MAMQNVSFSDSKFFLFTTKGIACRLSYTGNHAWRLQSTDNGVFDDFGAGQTLARDLGEEPNLTFEPVTCTAGPNETWTLTAPDGSRVAITAEPLSLQFYAPSGKKSALVTKIWHIWDHTISVQGKLTRDERTYGLGERFDRLNQRGRELPIFSKDEWAQWKGNSYCPIPIMTSSRGYGLFSNRFEGQHFDLDSGSDNGWHIMLRSDAPVDLYVFAGERIQDALYGYSVVTGFAPEPHDWLYGTQVCRYSPDFSTPEGIYAMEKDMDENDFPWDAIILEGWDTYDPPKLQSLAQVSAHLRARGKRVMMYQACGFGPCNPAAMEGLKPEYFVRRARDNSPNLPETDSYNPMDNPNGNRSTRLYLDYTNPEAWAWWRDKIWGPLLKEAGVCGCKIDFCELMPENEPLVYADGSATAGSHQRYPVEYNTLMYRLYNSQPGGGMNLSRGGGIGAQRYPFLWAGDQTREFFFLRVALHAVLSSGLSGIPFMSYDMSAYKPGRDPETDPEREVFVRGLEYTAFSANIQTHGSVKRPYDFDAPIKDLYRAYAKMHDAMRPYLVEQGKIACATGVPLMRALPLWDAEDPICLDCEDEYTLGDAFLVCPVLERTDKRDVYLPAGEWRDLYTGKVYAGKQTLADVEAPLSRIPVYVNTKSASAALPGVLTAMKPYLDTVLSVKA